LPKFQNGDSGIEREQEIGVGTQLGVHLMQFVGSSPASEMNGIFLFFIFLNVW
jgi:hypothetical protein